MAGVTTATPVSTPNGNVDFNANIITTDKMTGGYTAYQLWPNGDKISPLGKEIKDIDPVTLANVDSLFCYKADNKYDLFLCNGSMDFTRKEIIEITGPFADPKNPTMELVQMRGKTSTQLVNFYLALSTVPGGGGEGTLQPVLPKGNYTLNITVENNGQVIFSTKANI